MAIYCRLSEEDRNKGNREDDSNSIKNQKAMLSQYAAGQGWRIYDIYSDEDYAGSDRNRPQFRRLLADAENRKFDIILCKTQSRFTRELELVEKYIHGLFPAWGIRFISIVDNADTQNKGNKKARQINGLVNEWYLEDLSENIRSVLTNRRENGFHIGAFAPYGYQKNPEKKGHLIIDPEAGEIVKEIFSLFAAGYGKTAIAKILNGRGVPNPTEYKRRKGLRYRQPDKRGETLWKYHSVAAVLVNEVYIGNLVQGRYCSASYKVRKSIPRPKEKWIRVCHTHEPLIDKELWQIVQNKVKDHRKPIEATGMLHPFSGLVVCRHCGYAVRPHKSHGRYYLQCTMRSISDTVCPGAFIPEAELEKMILDELKILNAQLLDTDKLKREILFEKTGNARMSRIQCEQKIYQKKAEELTMVMQQLYTDRVQGVISPKDYEEMHKAFQEERKRYEGFIRSCRNRAAEMDAVALTGDSPEQKLEGYLSMDHLTRSMAEHLIHHITIGKRNKKTGRVPVSVFWNF